MLLYCRKQNLTKSLTVNKKKLEAALKRPDPMTKEPRLQRDIKHLNEETAVKVFSNPVDNSSVCVGPLRPSMTALYCLSHPNPFSYKSSIRPLLPSVAACIPRRRESAMSGQCSCAGAAGMQPGAWLAHRLRVSCMQMARAVELQKRIWALVKTHTAAEACSRELSAQARSSLVPSRHVMLDGLVHCENIASAYQAHGLVCRVC